MEHIRNCEALDYHGLVMMAGVAVRCPSLRE
jgi:hypothetical protein